MNTRFILPAILFIYTIQDMSKFLLGLGTGIYIGSYYNLKPVVEYIELEVSSKFIEIKKVYDSIEKKTEDKKEPEKKKSIFDDLFYKKSDQKSDV